MIKGPLYVWIDKELCEVLHRTKVKIWTKEEKKVNLILGMWRGRNPFDEVNICLHRCYS